MAGGRGERFWPRSRERTPKQLRNVYSNKTLLEETIIRARTITDLSRIYIGCNASLRKAILSSPSGNGFPEENFVVEPQAKNTAAIIALASLQIEKKYPGSVQVVLSADHFISPLDEFRNTIHKAIVAAESGRLVTLGIRPSRPETGYGYIESGDNMGTFIRIASFVEKPDLPKALAFINSGRHYWNSGIFVWMGSVILAEFEKHAPEIITPIRSAAGGAKLKNAFSVIPSEPVDKAILEKSDNIVMVESTFTWDDVGSWLSLERICPADSSGNIVVSQGARTKVAARNASSNIVATSKRLVAMLGVKDIVLVDEDDVLFVSTREGIGDIKGLIAEMREDPSLQKFLL